jgi:hypothetical protein
MSLPVDASDAASTKAAVVTGLTYVNEVETEFLSSFTVTDAPKPGRIPEASLHRMELCETQTDPPQVLPAVRAFTVVAAAEK